MADEKKTNGEANAYGIQAAVLVVLVVLKILVIVAMFSPRADAAMRGSLIATVLILSFLSLVTIFLRWTFVKESSAKAIMRSGSLHRIVLSKKKHRLAQEKETFNGIDYDVGDVIEDKNYVYKFLGFEWLGNLLGGLRFYIWRLEEVHSYKWTFTKSLPDGTIEPRKDEEVDYILIQDYGYGLEMKGKDVVDRDKVPVESSFTILARIINPHKALFEVGHWFETFMSLVQPVIRDYINYRSYAAMTDNQQLSKDITAQFHDEKITDESGKDVEILEIMRDRYGIELRSVQCRGIRLSGDYQDAQTEQWKAARDAERDIMKRSGSTTGAFLSMLARETGLSEADIQTALKWDPVGFEKTYATVIKRCMDFINRQLDADAGALRSFHFAGDSSAMASLAVLGEGLKGALNPAGASSPGAKGNGGSSPPTLKSDNTPNKKRSKKEEDDDDDEENDGWGDVK